MSRQFTNEDSLSASRSHILFDRINSSGLPIKQEQEMRSKVSQTFFRSV